MSIPNTTPLASQAWDYAGWKAARHNVITATQAGAISGSNPYTSMVDVWNDKRDPEWIEAPNRYLEERAALGRDREPAILEWAGRDKVIGGKLTANDNLLESTIHPGAAFTPDGYRMQAGARIVVTIVDAKTTQQDWLAGGVPQHIQDQMLWSRYCIEAPGVTVRTFVAVEQYAWSGKGKERRADLVAHYVLEVEADPVRLAFLLARVGEFQQNLADDIAPESDIDLRALEYPGDDSPDMADYLALQDAEAAMNERGDLLAEIETATARIAELEATIKAAPKVYGGRRVHLIGSRFTAKLVRSWRTSLDQSKLDPAAVRNARTWGEVETVKIEPTKSTTETEESTTDE